MPDCAWIAHGCEHRAQTDGQLLEHFIGKQDESAFEELVRRHGPMVYGVCRRLLSAHDADDAFQATFMVLVRKARSVVPRDLVGNWLYGVACRVALHARVQASRRRAREKQVVDMPHPAAPLVDSLNDLRPVLDLELSRLPEKYRAAIVLCDLEGRSRKDAARQIGVPEGTLSSRLATGRKMLAARLTRRGLAVGASWRRAATAMFGEIAQAVVPGTLAVSTVKAAAAGAAQQAVALGLLTAHAATHTEGVMKAMLISKLKAMVAVLLTLGMLTTGAGVVKLTADESSPGQDVARAQKNMVVEIGDKPKSDGPKPRTIVIDVDGDGLMDLVVPKQETKPPSRDMADLSNLIDSLIEKKQPFDRLEAVHSRALRDVVNCKSCHDLPSKPSAVVEQHLAKQPFDRLEVIHSRALRDVVNCKSCHNLPKPNNVFQQEKFFGLGQAPDKNAAGPPLPLQPKSTPYVAGNGTEGDILVVRIPKTGGPAADAEFMRPAPARRHRSTANRPGNALFPQGHRCRQAPQACREAC